MGIKEKLAVHLKASKHLYSLYYTFFSSFFRFVGLFVRMDSKLILFNCFGGKKYDDSPKAIYEQILKDNRFDEYKLVWALQNPEKMIIPGRATVVKSDTLSYFITALKARVWITNSSMERGLRFKKHGTLYLNTWHGSAIKVMGVDIKPGNKSFRTKSPTIVDIMLAQSEYDIETFSRAFVLPEECFRLTGLPRNDILANYTLRDVECVRQKLGIPMDKIVLLYAPTFREFSRDSSNEVVFNSPITNSVWTKVLGEKYVVLVRAHYEVSKRIGFSSSGIFIDVSNYPALDDLMIASDALISDYSSIIIDYSIMHKPIFCYAYDLDEYKSKRGMYFDLETTLPCIVHRDENTLLEDIVNTDWKSGTESLQLIEFQKRFATEAGSASLLCCNFLLDSLKCDR